MRRYFGFWLLIVALILAGCSARAGNNGVIEGAQVGQALPDAEFITFAGEKIRLHELRGRPVVLNFWATWCGPCKVEIPMLQAAYNATNRTGFQLLAVTEENERVVRDFIAAEQMTFPVLFDTGGRAGARYQVQAIPTTFFINADGVIVARHTGVLTAEMIAAYVAQIMLPPDAPDQPAPRPDADSGVGWQRPPMFRVSSGF